MATVRRRGKKWQVQIRLRRLKSLSCSFTFKSDAEQWARQTEASSERGDLQGSNAELRSVRLNELLDKYERTITPAKKCKASETYLLRVLRRHSIAALALDELTPITVCSYRDDRLKEVSPSSVRRGLGPSSSTALRLHGGNGTSAFQRTRSRKSPSHLRMRRGNEGSQMMSCSDLNDALEKSRHPILANVIRFAVHTGMRRSEILSIRWADIDFQARTVALADTKNGYPREVPLSPSGIAAGMPPRAMGMRDDAKVFPMSANALRLAWERLKKRAGIGTSDFMTSATRRSADSLNWACQSPR